MAAALAAMVLACATAADACGDKLLALGRGVRFEKISKSTHPALVACLWRSDPQHPNNRKKQRDMVEMLSSAGHRVQFAYSVDELDRTLASEPIDVVMVEGPDLDAVAGSVRKSSSKAAVVPVLYKPTKAQFNATARQYGRAVKAPAQAGVLLLAIDEAMETKSKQASAGRN